MRIFLAALVFLVFFSLDGTTSPAEAKRHVARHIGAARPQYNPKYAAFVVDGDTGKILFQEDADQLRHPASLTKMMTLYLLFEALESKRIKMETIWSASAYAAGKAKTNLNMSEGDKISVHDLMLAIIVKSANDCAVIAAENLGGSEENFAKMMNKRAKQLGMKNTHFVNASGLHDPQQVTSAKDMALLGIALKKHFPQYFPYFSYKSFVYNGTTYKGHNHVMEMYPGADGLKTGFVNASGFNLVTTASRRGINLVGVVIGGRTHQSRDENMMKLLDDGFVKAAKLKNQAYVAGDYKVNGKAEEENDDDNANPVDDTEPTPSAIGSVVRAAPAANKAAQPVAAPAPAVVTPAPAPAGVNSRSEVIDKVVAENDVDDAPEKPAAVQKPTDSIDQNEVKRVRPLVEARNDDNMETSKYVRTVAPVKQTKADRYKSSMIVPPLSGNASQPLFVPTPKDKPSL